MSVRTIYVKDDQLWQQAKACSPHLSMSEIIARALRLFIAASAAPTRG